MKISKNILNKARRVKLLGMDVDGVLTGGEIIILDSGEEVKVWNVKDRMGFYLVKRSGSGIKFAWITGRESKQVELRARESGIDFLYQDCMDKSKAIKEIADKLGIGMEEVAFIGDDLVDIPVIRNVGFSVCPKDALPEVKKEADYVSSLQGGKGILREVVDIVLKAQKVWGKATEGYI
ncbi:MAG: HAD hydrolase family protein [Endomicrobiales bacterium]|nr:HAD hydrolase family protein [Endomicrobiales bacterium]